ncbi:LysE family translocator [Coralloluteibacterium thermophilus]
MISGAAVLGMALVALGMVLSPGPNMMYLVSRTLAQGTVAGLVSLAGTMTGFLAYMTLANLGLAAVFVLVPWLYVGLKLLGAAYLLYLAWQILRPGGRGVFDVVDLPRHDSGTLFRMGLLTNLLNPKAAVMYVALIPQFIDPAAGSPVLQGFLLGGVQMTVSLFVNAAIVLAAGRLAGALRRRPAWMRWQRRTAGALLAVVGLKLAWDAPAPATG